MPTCGDGTVGTRGDCVACSKATNAMTAGDGTDAGTCPESTDVCLSSGECKCQKDRVGGGDDDGTTDSNTCGTGSCCCSNGNCKTIAELGVAMCSATTLTDGTTAYNGC